MAITDKMVLPDDVELGPVSDLDETSRANLEVDEGDWFVTRQTSRSRSSIVSADLADLLSRFRGGNTIAEAIFDYSRMNKLDPDTVLEDVWPALRRFVSANVLVPVGSYLADAPVPWYPTGTSVVGLTVDTCVRLVDDTQVYRAHDDSGRAFAIKVIDATSADQAALLDNEARALVRLDGSPSPRLTGATTVDGRQLLVMEWCGGVELVQAADSARGTAEARGKIYDLVVAVLNAYSSLHARGVIHGDVHPANLIVDEQGRVRILDFGLARILDDPMSASSRGGAPEYFDPDYALASITGKSSPPISVAAEQYSLAVLCYRIVAGSHYLDFSTDAAALLTEIIERSPRSFAEVGVAPWPEFEIILGRALSKDAAARYASVAQLGAAVAGLGPPRSNAPVVRDLAGERSARLIREIGIRLDPGGALFEAGPAFGPRASFMNGAAGIAYYLLREASFSGNPRSLAAADLWAERACALSHEPLGIYDEAAGVSEDLVGSVTPYHTRSGLELVRGLIAHARGDTEALIEATRSFVRAVDQPQPTVDPTLGSTSVLFAATHLIRCLGYAADIPDTTAARDELLRAGARAFGRVTGVIAEARAMARVATVAYTGAAHGWAGLLYGALTWTELTARPLPDGITRRLDELAAFAVREGRGVRWPMELGRSPQTFMNSWCHGAPGQVYLWNAAHRIVGVSRYEELAVAAAHQTSDEITVNPTMCCGLTGHVFALLNMFRHSGDSRWLRLAAERTRAAVASHQESPWEQASLDSLYRGPIGVALAAVELEYPNEARHPLFEL